MTSSTAGTAVVRAAQTAVLALTLLAAPLAAEGQQARKVSRVGYLTVPSRETAQGPASAFQAGLRDLGWIEGHNIVIDFRFADGKFERLPDLAAELVRLRPDAIVAGVNAAGIAARDATRTIPIVMLFAFDPVSVGLAASLARPGANITGLTAAVGGEIYGKQLELLKNAFPRTSRVAIIVNEANPFHVRALRETEDAARPLGLHMQIVKIRDPSGFDHAFSASTTSRVDAIFVLPDALFYQHRVRVAQLAAKTRLPVMWGQREYVVAGGLMGYGVDLNDLGRRAATYVDKILKGAKPGDLPIEQPTKFELVINMKTAKALGLTIPSSLLLRADQVLD